MGNPRVVREFRVEGAEDYRLVHTGARYELQENGCCDDPHSRWDECSEPFDVIASLIDPIDSPEIEERGGDGTVYRRPREDDAR
jgi:hypothetical protein